MNASYLMKCANDPNHESVDKCSAGVEEDASSEHRWTNLLKNTLADNGVSLEYIPLSNQGWEARC